MAKDKGPPALTPSLRQYHDDSAELFNRWKNKEVDDREYYQNRKKLVDHFRTGNVRFAYRNPKG